MTYQLRVKIKNAETDGFTIESSDPDVATVDETGLVTAVGQGTATITVTTDAKGADGEPLVATVNVEVINFVSIDAEIIGQVSDAEGDHIAKISLEDLSYETVVDAPAQFSAGARGGNIYFGVEENGTAYAFDADTFEPSDWSDYSWSYFAVYPPMDLANCPDYIDAAGSLNQPKFFMTTEIGYFVDPNYYGFNLGSYLPTMSALAFAGLSFDEEEQVPLYVYLLMTADGMIYELDVDYQNGSLGLSAVVNTGLALEDQSDASMAVIDTTVGDEQIYGLVIAVRSTGTVWFVDLTTGDVGLFGYYDADSIDALVGSYDNIASVVEDDEGRAPAIRSFVKGADKVVINAEQLSPAAETVKEAKEYAPSLGKVMLSKTLVRGDETSETEEDGIVCFDITEEENVTNGLIAIEYDPELLTFEGADSNAALISANESAEGVVVVAYAAPAAIPAGDIIASLRFSFEGDYVSSELTVTTFERGYESMLEETETVAFEKENGDHNYEEIEVVEATCTEDGLATYKCSKCGDTKEEVIPALGHTAVDVDEIPATCTEAGVAAGKKCSVCGEILEGFEEILPTGHAWDEGTEKIAASCEGAGIIEYVCANCGEVRAEAVYPTGHTPVDVAEVPATCTKAGVTAGKKCSVCGAIIEGLEEIKATGHDFGSDGNAETCAVCGEKNPNYKPPVQFKDVPADAYFKDAVDWAVANGITSGMSADTFAPDNACTRAQVVTFLWRAAGSPEPTANKNPFSDVAEGDYFYKAVLWAVESGITKGTSATAFSPDATCTRGQIVTFLWRANGSPEPTAKNNPFSDVTADDYFLKAVLWAVENNVTKGMSASTFAPEATCSRAQVVTFMYRAAVK